MKNKPTRHKETNTFQFKPFSERVNEIDIDVFHRVAHRNEEDDEEVETYFHKTLQKWNYLNLTEGYSSFKKKVRNIVTLPQLLNEKQFVVDTLIEYLKQKDVLFLQPLLELVVAAAKDLQKDFYEYFPNFLSIIIDLLQTKDTEQIEYTFTSLAYLFKFLWRYLVQNAKTVFNLLLPLLADTQPAYINNFAAESFAFVVRKVKDKSSFLRVILNILEENPSGVPGCGKLLYEVVSGVPGQFHSCAEQILPIYFNLLNDESVNQRLAYSVLKEITNCCLQNMHPQKCHILWIVLLNVIDTSIEKNKNGRKVQEREKSLVLISQLLYIIISYKSGKFLTDPVPLVKKMVQLMDIFYEHNDVIKEVINIAVAILLAANIKLMQETSSQILLKILSVQNVQLFYGAIEKLIDYSSFETLILPHFLKHCIAVDFNENILYLLTKIIKAKAPPSLNGINFGKWKKYILDIRAIKPESTNFLVQELNKLSNNMTSINAFRILVILPHLKPLPEEVKNSLKNAIVSLYTKILNNENTEDTDITRGCFAFLLAVEAAIHILEPEVLHDFLNISNMKMLDLINKYSNSKFILNAMDLYITYFGTTQFVKEYINLTSFDALHENIKQKLESPFSETRLIAAHLYSLFTNVKEITLASTDTEKTAMELVYIAESQPITVQNYRDRLLQLQSLVFEGNAVSNLKSKYRDFPLRYLLGNLYVNFSLLWEPVSKIIATYASKECEQFWPIFLAELRNEHMENTVHESLFECDVMSALETAIQKSSDKPDHENYKILLWKCMAHFSHFCETKNRDLTGMFIEFVNYNFFKTDSEDAKCCSILKTKLPHSSGNVMNEEMEVDDSDNEEEIEDVNEKKSKISVQNKQVFISSKHFKTKLLIAQLQIFEKVANPRTLYREPEIQQIYLDLLSSKNSDIQKAALNCLLTYKYKYLVPYKESLYNLIDEKNLKNEFARFKIDKESNMVQDEHRDDFIPILMRIIYAKMVIKTGLRTGGKGGGVIRRKMVLRFLAGTQEDEMIIFTKMAFKPFKNYISLDLNEKPNLKEVVRNVMDKVDLGNVIPPKRLQSAVNLLGIVIEQFGGKMASRLLPYLLGLIMCILAEVTRVLQKVNEVEVRYLTTIKNIRTSCISILARFFGHFEDYEWAGHEIDALFNVAVFPWLEKLPMEGIHSPTALLKLFMAWSQNSRFYPLFIKHRDDDKSISPLPFVMRLLLGPKTHPSVINAILDIIEKMVTLQDYGKPNETENDMETDTVYLPITSVTNNLLEVNQDKLASGVNYGSTILLPHVPDILEYIKNKLNKYNRGVNKTELVILSRTSEFVTDAEGCNTLLTLILPILVKKAAIGEGEETLVELLTTAINLVKNVKKPEIHIRALTPLLGTISSVPARKLLMQLYSIIADNSAEDHRETLIQNCNLLISLNSWDRRWIDQPDFEKRLNAFTEINAMVEKNVITLEFGVAIIYNCFYFLKSMSDLAIRDYAGQCLKLIGPKLAKQYREAPLDRRYLMDDTILTILRKGIVSKNDTVRLQSIAFLGHMAMESPEVHPVLRDLFLLTNKQDPEVDFFENMQHLQLHRKGRALLKFCTIAKTLKKSLNPRTLTQFILPLASSYLCNETYVSKNSIVDAAIETVGTVCRLLPWHHYEIILKYYLGKLRGSVEYQKQLVRIIVTILDSFHFDLSKHNPLEESTAIKTNSQAQRTEITDMEKDEEIKGESVTDEINDEDASEEAQEKLDEALNREDIENVEEVVEKSNEKNEEGALVIEKQILLSQLGARRVVFSISKGLLPQLHRSIIARTRHETSHKFNRKQDIAENEEEELMRVPIALALVKLLQKLPERILNTNLPGIFMKLCTFLKSRLESVRRVTREILQKIMITLGPKYLHYLLRELNTLLTKGFQVHVLAFTVQSVLVALKPYFQKFDINANLQSILSVCKVDLFGPTAEEKEVIGIVKNVSEAKSTKSYDIFHILAQFITESCLLDLILPLKEVLMKTHSHKTIQKVVASLKNIVLGLADNTFIPLEQMLIFLYGTTSEIIPQLMPSKKKERTEKETEALAREKPDCFLIAPEPKNKMGIKTASKTSKSTNAHVIIEFGLKLFHILLKREKISGAEYKPYVEPFVPLLSDCLKSQHVKLSTLALQCLNWILKMDLIAVHDLISEICSSIFNILHKYAAAGLSKGDNFDLVMAAFKCMSVLVRDVKHFTISADQLKALILYAEQDLYNSDKQATAFTLLKAIISRKMIVPEMHPVMEKIATLSITSELDHVRQQSRSVFYSYLMEYPLGKKLDKHVSFYLTQLSYEMQPGRLSALQMLHNIVTGFPLKALIDRGGLILLMAGARLVNDEDPTCRKLCAKCIKEMIVRIPNNKRSQLFDIVLEWLRDSKITHRTLAAQLCGIFVSVEKDEFQSRLNEALPLLLKQFYGNNSNNDDTPGRFVKLCTDTENFENGYSNIKDPERMKDHHLFQVLQLLLKISAHCTSFLQDKEYRESVRSFAEYSQSLLAHPHLWVRLAATQMIGFILASLDMEKMIDLVNNPEKGEAEDGYMYSAPVETLKSLSLDLIAQLQPNMTFEELADQVVKNLIFVARILKSINKYGTETEVQNNENKAKDLHELSLPWLVRRLRKAVNIEITRAPKSTSVRTAIFKWIAGVIATVPIDYLKIVLFNLMSPLVREMSCTEEKDTALRRLAKEAANMIKKRLGSEEYIALLSRVQQKLDIKKAERRKTRTQQMVKDPELAAKRKIARQQKKKETKKRKLENLRGKKVSRKRPKKEVDLEMI